ncbi:hypothetical protein DFJ73DRAFT_69161 [Zopfochytrium polystomum]|nr:hypothetical protein DFJ73DRAFT_69161 [Zopfochytrium polystomum]
MALRDALDEAALDISRIYDNLPLDQQHAVMEHLLEKIALSSPSFVQPASDPSPPFFAHSPDTRSTESDAWQKICFSLGSLRQTLKTGKQPSRRDSPRSTVESGGPESNNLQGDMMVLVKAPEGVDPVIRILRRLQRSPAARLLFDGVQITTQSSDTGEKRSKLETLGNTFSVIETHMSTILLLAPSVILRSTSTPTDSEVPESSANSRPSRSVSSYPGTSLSLNRVLTASTALSAIIKAVVSVHNVEILDSLVDPHPLEEYGGIVDGLGEGMSKVMKFVKCIRDWNSELGKIDDANAIYNGLLKESLGFVRSLLKLVEFCYAVLKPKVNSNLLESHHPQSQPDRQDGVLLDEVSARRTLQASVASDESVAPVKQGMKNSDIDSAMSTSPSTSTETAGVNTARAETAVDRLIAQEDRDFLPRRSHSSPSGFGHQILHRPGSQLVRIVSTNEWRVKFPPDEDPDNLPVDSHNVVAGKPTKVKEDRWSRMLSEVVIPGRPNLSSSASAISEGTEDTHSLSSGALDLTPPATPDHHDLQPLSMDGASSSSTHDEKSGRRRVINAAMGKGSSAEESATPVPRFRRNSSSRASNTSGENQSSIANSENDSVRITFESLKTVGRRGGQGIPTYDSQGRRIGTFDRGIFFSETEMADTEDDPLNRNVSIKGNLLHMIEDGFDVLVMEKIAGRLHIIAGTAEKLVHRLADDEAFDIEYVDCMVQMHSFFIPAMDLLDNLVARFYVQPPENPADGEREYFLKWKRPIQLKVLTVIARWVKLQAEEFERDAALRERLQVFLAEIWSAGFRSEADRIRRVLTVQVLSTAWRSKSIPVSHGFFLDDEGEDGGTTSAPSQHKPISRNPLLSFGNAIDATIPELSTSMSPQEISPCLFYDAREIARYLTIVDQSIFSSISTFDYLLKLSGSNYEHVNSSKRDTGPGRIDYFVQRSNLVRNWVALEICSTRQTKARRKTIEKFLHVAKHCRELNNFHSCLLIMSALLSPAVQRLKRTWKGVSAKDMLSLQYLEKFLDPSGNMRSYRRAYAAARPPSIPFFPVVMKDITFLNDGNASTRPAHPATPIQLPTQNLSGLDQDRGITAHLGSFEDAQNSRTVNTPQQPSGGVRAAEASSSNLASVVASGPTDTRLAPHSSTAAGPVLTPAPPSGAAVVDASSSSSTTAGSAPALLINFDKYRTIVQLLARYTTAATEQYEFAPLLLPIVRRISACTVVGTAGEVSSAGSTSGFSGLLHNPVFPPPTVGTIESGGASGVMYAEALALTVERRLSGAADERAMTVAWEWAVQIDVDEPA